MSEWNIHKQNHRNESTWFQQCKILRPVLKIIFIKSTTLQQQTNLQISQTPPQTQWHQAEILPLNNVLGLGWGEKVLRVEIPKRLYIINLINVFRRIVGVLRPNSTALPQALPHRFLAVRESGNLLWRSGSHSERKRFILI